MGTQSPPMASGSKHQPVWSDHKPKQHKPVKNVNDCHNRKMSVDCHAQGLPVKEFKVGDPFSIFPRPQSDQHSWDVLDNDGCILQPTAPTGSAANLVLDIAAHLLRFCEAMPQRTTTAPVAHIMANWCP